MRTLAITQNVTIDGSIEMLGDWFDPQGRPDQDTTDLLEELHRQDRGRCGGTGPPDLRGHAWSSRPTTTGITEYLNRVQKYVVTTTMTDPQCRTPRSGEPAVALGR